MGGDSGAVIGFSAGRRQELINTKISVWAGQALAPAKAKQS